MTHQHRFLAALKTLQDWYADSVKARDYNSPASSSSKPGAVVLRIQRYPGTKDWIVRFMSATSPAAREAVCVQIEEEYERLVGRPSVEAYRDYWGKTRYRLAQ